MCCKAGMGGVIRRGNRDVQGRKEMTTPQPTGGREGACQGQVQPHRAWEHWAVSAQRGAAGGREASKAERWGWGEVGTEGVGFWREQGGETIGQISFIFTFSVSCSVWYPENHQRF